MNQITNVSKTSTSFAAMSYARRLAAQGKLPGQIGVMVRAGGFTLSDAEAQEVWNDYAKHQREFHAAARAGE